MKEVEKSLIETEEYRKRLGAVKELLQKDYDYVLTSLRTQRLRVLLRRLRGLAKNKTTDVSR